MLGTGQMEPDGRIPAGDQGTVAFRAEVGYGAERAGMLGDWTGMVWVIVMMEAGMVESVVSHGRAETDSSPLMVAVIVLAGTVSVIVVAGSVYVMHVSSCVTTLV